MERFVLESYFIPFLLFFMRGERPIVGAADLLSKSTPMFTYYICCVYFLIINNFLYIFHVSRT